MTSPTPKAMQPSTHGEEREKLLKLLGATLSDSRFSTVTRILAKDPTLSLEAVMFSGERMHFSKACVQAGYLRGLDVAKECGLDFNAPQGPVTLLEVAIGRGDAAAVDHLISLGADVNLAVEDGQRPGAPPLCRALVSSVTLSKDSVDFRIPRILMDAGAGVNFPDHLDPPAFIMANASWTGRESQMAKLLSDLKNRGASMDARSPKSKVAPVRLTLGAKNPLGAVAFIHLGASTDEASIGGDIIELAIKNKLEDAVPEIQRAIMARAAQEANATMTATVAAAKEAASQQAEAPVAPKSRRHMPTL